MKWKIGALVIAAVLCVCMLPAGFVYITGGGQAISLGTQNYFSESSKSNVDENILILQIDNTNALYDGEVVAITDADGVAIAPIVDESGNTMLPLRYLAETFGAEVGYDEDSRATTLTVYADGETAETVATTDEESVEEAETTQKIVVQLAQGSTTMVVNGVTQTITTAPVNVDGTLYVPVRAVSEAFSWQVGFVDRDQGHYVIISNGDAAFTDEETESLRITAQQLLGYSVTQYMNNSLIMRVDAAGMLVNNVFVELPADQAVIELESGYYLPSTYMSQLSNGKIVDDEVGNLLEDGKIISFDVVEVDGMYYHNLSPFAAAMDQEYLKLGDGIIMMLSEEMLRDDMPYDGLVASIKSSLPLEDEKPVEAEYYVALTFDDGPAGSDETGNSATLLSGLKEYNAHATFFVCGYRVVTYNSYGDRYLAEGHELGNHTMDHKDLTSISESEVYAQMEDSEEVIQKYLGATTLMRPTGGAYNDQVKEVMADLGYPMIMWSVDTQDWKYRDADYVYEQVMTAKDGDIVLMHDLYDTTVEGALRAIADLSAQGYAFVTVSELAEIRGVELQAGEVYNSFYPTAA